MIPTLRSSLALLLLSCVYSAAQTMGPVQKNTPSGQAVDGSGLYLKVGLDSPFKASKLKPGDEVLGRLFQDVYSGGARIFPAFSAVRLTVDRLDRHRRAHNDHWPWVINAFTPRHENWPVFHIASVTNQDGRQVPLGVSVVTLSKEVEVESKPKKNSKSPMVKAAFSKNGRRELGPLLTLIASKQPALDASPLPESVNIPAGTEANVILLEDISASKNHARDSFHARLVEPVVVDSKILLPEGTLLDGSVLKTQPPRILGRSGSIALTFTNMTTPIGTGSSIAASVAGAQINEGSHTVIDPEGHMHGDRPGKAWMLVNLGTTGGMAKVADDGTQLVIEALVSTATDVSTAGTAKIVSTCASAIFMLTRHGRDVVLPKYTQMKIVFDRPVLVSNRVPRPRVADLDD